MRLVHFCYRPVMLCPNVFLLDYSGQHTLDDKHRTKIVLYPLFNINQDEKIGCYISKKIWFSIKIPKRIYSLAYTN